MFHHLYAIMDKKGKRALYNKQNYKMNVSRSE